MRRLVTASTLAFAISLPLLVTPAGAADDVAALKRENAELQAENKALKLEIEKLEAELIKRRTAGSASTAGATTAIGGYTDLAGSYAASKVADLVKLGVLAKGNNSKFNPQAPISRAEFVTWLVRSNDTLRKDEPIRLAEPGTKSSFKDMTGKEPSFPYVQGMMNAGWAVGYDDGTFKPQKALTREEMIAIKTPLDANKQLRDREDNTVRGWADWEKIDKRFFGPMCFESLWQGTNWERVFGKTKVCDPQKPVTRAEAAACVWQIGFSDSAQNPTKLANNKR